MIKYQIGPVYLCVTSIKTHKLISVHLLNFNFDLCILLYHIFFVF